MYISLVFMYLAVRLISDPLSGLWVVLVTKWVAKYSAYLLWYLLIHTVLGMFLP